MSIIVTCPHCNLLVEILEINCAIFRHGVFKKDNKQINPHASKIDCYQYIKDDLIIGCAKPFKLVLEGDTYQAIICDYI
jgi:hypothetical protein